MKKALSFVYQLQGVLTSRRNGSGKVIIRTFCAEVRGRGWTDMKASDVSGPAGLFSTYPDSPERANVTVRANGNTEDITARKKTTTFLHSFQGDARDVT